MELHRKLIVDILYSELGDSVPTEQLNKLIDRLYISLGIAPPGDEEGRDWFHLWVARDNALTGGKQQLVCFSAEPILWADGYWGGAANPKTPIEARGRNTLPINLVNVQNGYCKKLKIILPL